MAESTVNPISQDVSNAVKAVQAQNSDAIEGLNSPDEDALAAEIKNLPKSLENVLNLIFDVDDKKSPMSSFINATKESIASVLPGANGMNPNEEITDGLNKMVSSVSGPIVQAKLRPLPNDLVKLDGKNSLGYLLLYWKLDEIQTLIDPKKTKKPKKEDEGGGGGLFGGLLKGLGGAFKSLSKGIPAIIAIAGALGIFALALVLFTKMDMVKAFVGLALFTGFMIGMVTLSNYLDKQKAITKFKNLGIASFFLAASLGIFAISLWITSAVISGQSIFGLAPINPGAVLIGIALFAGFVFVMGLISNVAGKNTKNFQDLAKSMISLSVALGMFSISLSIMSMVMNSQDIIVPFINLKIPGFNPWMAILGVGLFSAFVFVMSKVANQYGTKAQQAKFRDFTVTTLMMSGSLIAFSAAMWVAGFIPLTSIGKGIIIAAGLAGFIFVMSKLAKQYGTKAYQTKFINLTIASLLLTGVFAVFTLVMKLASTIQLQDLIQGIVIAGGLAAFLFVMGKMSEDYGTKTKQKKIIEFAITALVMTGVFAVFTLVIKLASDIPLAGIAKGLLIAGGMIGLATLMGLASNIPINPVGLAIMAVAMVALAGILFITAKVLQMVQPIEISTLAKLILMLLGLIAGVALMAVMGMAVLAGSAVIIPGLIASLIVFPLFGLMVINIVENVLTPLGSIDPTSMNNTLTFMKGVTAIFGLLTALSLLIIANAPLTITASIAGAALMVPIIGPITVLFAVINGIIDKIGNIKLAGATNALVVINTTTGVFRGMKT
jgi:hypothetical protein